jgi:VanZ family protein
MAVIFALSSLPGSAVPGHFGNAPHFFEYALLGGLYLIALPRLSATWRRIGLAVLLASLYGVTDEFHQSFVPGRTPDIVDWLLDTAGAATGAAVVAFWQRRVGRPVSGA